MRKYMLCTHNSEQQWPTNLSVRKHKKASNVVTVKRVAKKVHHSLKVNITIKVTFEIASTLCLNSTHTHY